MNAQPKFRDLRGTADAPLDARLIEDHALIERYLTNKLPVKGARRLEDWCRANPDYLRDLGLAERAQASIRLLDAGNRPVDFREPPAAWWRSPYLLVALIALALSSGAACGWLTSKNGLLRSELEAARLALAQGSWQQPAVETTLRITPDRAHGLGKARIIVGRAAPQLIDLRIDVGFSKALLFRVVVDKSSQGRALVIANLEKDSSDELRMTFNTSGLAPGMYVARIEALPPKGTAFGLPTPEGWMTLEVK